MESMKGMNRIRERQVDTKTGVSHQTGYRVEWYAQNISEQSLGF